MTVPRATKRRTSLERHKDEVIALLLGGYPDVQIIDKFKVARSSLSKFKQRHRDQLTALQAEVAKQVEDYAIAQKVNRIAELNDRWERAKAVIQERAKSMPASEAPGAATGLLVKQYKMLGGGEFGEVVAEYKVDTGLMAEMRAMEKEADETLDQRPRTGITFNDNRKVVFIREYGFSAE